MDTTADTIIDGRYLIKREIARGGMAIVYEALQLFSKRSVAVKLLLPNLAGAYLATRLQREAEALTMARHRNVVSVLDAGETQEGRAYLVMEMLDGRSLAGILAARGRLGVSDVMSIAAQLCGALGSAHAAGVVHRDVTPSNVVVSVDEQGEEVVKLLDFGIAKLAKYGADREMAAEETKLTQANALLGTVEYMAPECYADASGANAASDVYALAVTLYECLTGSVPFEGSFTDVLVAVSTGRPPTLSSKRPDVPAALDSVFDRALSRDPESRFPDARSFLTALSGAVETKKGPTQLLGVARKISIAPPKPTPTPTVPATPHGRAATARRRFARAPYITPARLRDNAGACIDGRTEDISEGGLLVVVERPIELAENAEVTVRFATPVSGRIVTVACRARWVKTARGARAMGLEFVQLKEEACAEVKRYVEIMGAER